MNTISLHITLFLSMMLSLAGMAQNQDHILRNFYGTVSDDGIVLRWTIRGGNQCDGTIISRAADNLNFDKVGEIPGICGGADDQSYLFEDLAPVENQINYYRLDFGQLGPSTALEVAFYNYNQAGYLIANSTDMLSFHIKQLNPSQLEVQLYNSNGVLLYSKSQSSPDFEIPKYNLDNGVILYRISDDKGFLERGKLVL